MLDTIKAVIAKILTVLPNTLMGILGVAQAIVKFLKEVCTLAIDILSPVIPDVEAVVLFVREKINILDSWLEKLKELVDKINDFLG